MADINSMKVQESMTEGTNEETISIIEILLRFARYWKWFVLGIAVALVIVFIYLRYTTPVYSVSSSIILKEARTISNNARIEAVSR